ncbi:hypothetical protein HKT18_11680 [Flavobacterium sp. IMCC34852]|uniref:T9SS type A sorting domain-containing protein n=1 Tax=Flavobacterium rivulicola TaxID=2732161 RepID=A0A7Y3RAE6_9FLAO|nr:BNR-repeat neuraminidase N-terminal domain-containing protein [Flavobacterium sp. IMCC34852]NNT72878.1 hypothetical protein [Flavobacterium sp. IMCC34852]
MHVNYPGTNNKLTLFVESVVTFFDVKSSFANQKKTSQNHVHRALLMMVIMLGAFNANSQVANYTFAASSGSYTPLSGGTSWQSGTAIATNTVSTAITLPWAFTYNGKSYSSLYISNNGFIAFANQASNAPAAGNVTPISLTSDSNTAANSYDGAISAFGMDLVASTVSGAAPDISYGTSGSDFIIQYTDLARTGQAGSDRITFQIRLTQTTNVINLVYNTPTVSAATTSPQVGLRGASHWDWKNLSGIAATTWTAPTVSNTAGTASSNLTMRFSTTATASSPVAGQTYTFTPFAALAAPTYATIPVTENFDASWANGYSTGDLPSAASWRTWPSYGDRSVRRNDVVSGAGNGWGSNSSGSVTISSPDSGSVARFHNFFVGGQANSFMDYYVDFSSATGSKTVLLDLYGTSSNVVYISVSTDGGATFGTPTTFTTSGTWTTRSVDLGNLTSPTGVVRIENRGNWSSSSDVGMDNFRIVGACATPTSLAASANAGTPGLNTIPGSFTAAAVAPTGYLVVRTTTNVQPVPVTATTYTVGSNAIGYIEYVNTTAGSWTSTGLTPNTTYYYWVFSYNNTSCGGGPVYSATATTFSATTASCASINAIISINGAANVSGVSYTNINAAVADLMTCGISQPTILEIASGYTTEASYPIVLGLVPGANPTNTITIRSATGVSGKTITSSNTTATIDINGGKYWIIDGRPGGSGALASTNLTIENTSSAIGGTAIRFINDATNNTVQYANLKAAYGSTTSGVVNILGGTPNVTGNDNNTITLNNINGSGTVYNGIYAIGTTNTNNNNTISNNNIYDFFNAGSATNGILISSSNTDFTITGNRIFQTATRTFTISNTHTGINVSNSSGNNFDISSNQIGGVAALTGGPTPVATYTLAGTIANRYRGISVSVGTTAASSIQGNTISGFSFASTSGSTTVGGPWCGIYVGAGNVNVGNITGNTIGSTTGTNNITITISSSSGVSTGIFIDGGSVHNISNNTIGSITALGSASTVSTGFTGIRVVTSTTCTVNNNTIGSTSGASIVTSTGSTNTTVGALGGINNTSSATISITNNTVSNLNNAQLPSSSVSSNFVFGVQSSAGTNTITGNTVRNLSTAALATGTTTSASVIGISNTSTTTPLIVSSNTIHTLSNSNAGAVLVTGILNNGPTTGTNIIAKNYIHSLSSPSNTAVISGIYAGTGTTTYQNNMIALGNGLTNSAQINGVNEAFGNNNFYHNSIYIGGSAVVSGTVNTFAFNSTVTTNTRAYRNNIFVNSRSNVSGTGAHFAVQVGGTTVNPTGLTTNNNIFFVNGTGGAIGRFNAVSRTTISDWRTATGQDAASFETDPQFLDTANNDLHINPTLVTLAEANGFDVGVIEDFDNQTRSGLTPVDIGADAGNFTGQDAASPIITYTALSNGFTNTDQTLTATITDTGSSVATSGIGLPVLYYKVNSGAYTAVTGVSIGSNQYTFTFGAAATNGNDVVSYYVVAQDLASTPNISVFPSAGATGFTANPPAVSTPPTTPSTYTALAGISGVKTVCASGCDFSSLTNAGGAFATINSSIVNGNLELQIGSDLTAETGANALNAFVSPYTLKLYPTGSARVISGSLNSAALIKLNGADRITIDGSIGGTGTDRSLTITNTSTTSPTAIALISLGTGSGATNNTIKNSIINTGTKTSSYAIALGGSTPGSAGDDNDNTSIQNNLITFANIAIFSSANATGVTDNLLITQNTLGTLVSASAINTNAINLVQANSATISLNEVLGITQGSSFDAISLGAGVTNTRITRNSIHDLINNGTNRVSGIGLATGNNANITIDNNNLYSIINNGTSGNAFSASGIYTSAGTGFNIYYNSINLSGDRDAVAATKPTSVSSAIMINNASAANLDIRNNILVNTQTATTNSPKSYAIYSTAANTAFANINNNDYYVSGTQGVLGYLSSDRTTIAAWRTATGKDVNSFSQNPQFVSNTDLHINTTLTSYVESTGTPISGITTDFDGDNRNGTTPDVGADEGNFIVPVNNDFAATAFIDPLNAGSKTVGVAFIPQASFSNAGVLDQTNVTVRYRILDAGLTEVYNQTAIVASLSSLATTTVSFPSVTVATAGSYTIYAKAELAGDSISTNDEITGTLTITDPYISSTVTQNTNNVLAGAVNQQVIGLQVVTSASTGTLTSLTFDTNGTTNVADISNAKIYYTGTSNTFATTTQYGSTVAVPNGSHTVTGSQALPNGTSYFWLTYDISGAATTNNVADAEITNVIVNGITRTPSVTAPAGSRVIVSPMSGTYLIGASQVFPNFTSLTTANTDLTLRGVSGAVVFELQSDYAATETFPITMGTVAGVSATNTVTIKPGNGVVKTITGNNATALFNLNGAKYVTIDGSNTVNGTTKDLTISNTNTGGAVIYLNTDATNNTIKNTILNGVSTSTSNGVIWIGALAVTTGNDNNTIHNNDISGGATATAVGIFNSGSTTSTATKNSGTVITNNNIFNFSNTGIRDGGGSVGALYTGNNIYEVATQTTAITGISIRTNTLEGFTFNANKIYDLKTTSTSTVYGIHLVNMLSAGPTGTITNNMITIDAIAPLTAYGIFDEVGSGRVIDIYNNTISVSGNVSGASNSAAYYYSTAATTNFKNNILSNTRNGGTGKHYAFRTIASLTTLTSDYNDLYVGGGTGSVLANNTTADQTTLTAWQTATGKDAASVNILPVFTSATDLHISPASVGLDNLGTPIATVTTDIDGETRNLITPDLGADEFTIPACVTANGGTATGSTQFCTSGTPSIAASGYSVGSGTTYQWYSSTMAADYPNAGTAVSGQVSPSALTIGVVSTTSYYWLRVTCGTDSSTANSNLITVTINTPATLSATATQSTICSGGSGTTLNATGGATYSWTSNPVGFTSTSATPTVNPTQTTVYTVNGTDANGCTANQGTVTVTVVETPSTVSISPSTSTICSGTVVTLNAIGGSVNSSASVSATSPTTNSSIPDVSTTGVSQVSTISGIPVGATITKVDVTFTLNHGYLQDAEVVLTAPNGKVIALAADQGPTTTGVYSNVVITSDPNAAVLSTTATPITGTYKANATASGSLIAGSSFGANLTQTFSDLFTVPNGAWTVTAYDDAAIISGTLNSSSVTVYYTYNSSPSIEWTASAGNLYTSAAAASVNDGVNGLIGSGSFSTVYAKPSSPSTTVTYTATANNGGCTSVGSSTVTITPLPSFTVSPITICNGQTGTLTAVSSGSNSYSWSPVGGGATLAGNPRNVSPIVTTTYNVTATSNDTTPACQSTQQVTVTVNQPGTIVSATDSRTVSPGQDTTFEVVTTGTVTYQWQVNDNINGWVNIDAVNPNYSGENTDILTVTNITLAFDTFQYRCLVTGLAPCATLTPLVGVLNVTNTGFLTQPSSVNLCGATSTSFTIATTGDEPYNIQWQVSTDDGASYTDIVDGFDATTGLTFDVAAPDDLNAKTLNVSGITVTNNGYRFKCQLDFFLDSNVATLTVNVPVSFAQDLATAPINLCKVNTTTNLTIITQGNVSNLVWKYATSATGPWNTLGSLPAGTTYDATNPSANNYNLAVTTSASTPVGSYFYKAFITGAGSGLDKCPDVESSAANIVINQPTVTVSPTSAIYCSPGTGVTLTTGGAATYSWSPNNGSLDTVTGSTVVATPSTNTTYTVTGTDVFGCTNSATTTVNVGATITVAATNATALSCPGSTVQLNSVVTQVVPNIVSLINPAVEGGFESGATFPLNGWTVVNGTNNNWFVGSAAGTQSGTNAAYVGTNNIATANASVNHFYRDIAIPAGMTDISLSFFLKMAIVDSTFDYLYVYTTTTSRTPVAGTTPTTGYTQVYSNTTTAYANYTQQSVTLPNSLSGTTVRLVFTYKSDGASPFSAPAVDNISLSGNALGNITYAWTSTPSGFTSSIQNPTATPSSATTYNVTATSASGCTATSSVLVNVQTASPTITLQPTAATTSCQGGSASFSVSATSTTAMTYQWRKNGVNLVNGTGISGATSSTLSLTGLTLASAGNYDVVVSTCTSLSTTSTEAVLSINPLPTASISGTTSLCQNATAPSVTFTGSAGTAPYTFTYKLNGGSNQTITTTSGNSVSLTIPTNTVGSYIYTLVSVQDSSTTGCSQTQSGTATVTINALPAAPVLSSNSPVCESAQLNLTAAVAPQQGYSLFNNSGVSFVDIETTGTSIGTLTDDNENNITIPSFTFNGTAYTTARVGTNGAIVFGSTTNDISATNAALPNASNTAGNVLLAPYWDDLDVQTSPTIKTQTVGNLFIIQFTNITHNDFTTGGITFQVQLNLTNGQIHFVYPDVIFGNTSYDSGASATIGIQYSSSSALQVSSNSAALTNGQSITFIPASYSFAWTGPNGFTSSVQNPSIANVSTAAIGTYTLELTNTNGCKSSATVSAIVNPLPTASISGTVTLCRNSASPTVTFTGANGTAPYTFTYKVNGGANQTIVSIGNTATLTAQTTSAGVFTYTLVSVQDSSSTACSQLQTGTATVTIVDNLTYYRDADNDGYGNAAISIISCNASEPGYVTNNTDCNDSVAAINPSAPEINFNSIDENCNNNLFDGHAPVVVNVTTPSGALAAMTTPITCSIATNTSPYSGASVIHKFRVTRTSPAAAPVEFERASRTFAISELSIAAYSATYEVQATAIVNGEEQPYNGNTATFTTPAAPVIPLVSQVVTTQCNQTLATINSYIYANNSTMYNNAQIVDFEVERYENNVLTHTQVYSTNVPYFRLSSLSMPVTYGTLYKVRVRYGYNSYGSEIRSDYSTQCDVTTPSMPLVQVVSSQCGQELASINAYVYSTVGIGSANLYEFRVTRILNVDDAPVTVTQETIQRIVPYFRLTMLTNLYIGLGKEYSIDVRYRVNSYGTQQWSDWSQTACSVYTPGFPTTGVVDAQCNLLDFTPAMNQYIYADVVTGATQYRFRLELFDEMSATPAVPIYSEFVDSPANYVRLNQFTGLLPQTTYVIKVSVQMNGEFGPYGKDCAVTTPAFAAKSTPAMVGSEFEATVYPNPFTTSFSIALETSSESTVGIKVYDMVGRLVDQRTASVTELKKGFLGDQYPSGVYNVIITQDEVVKTLRIVKR